MTVREMINWGCNTLVMAGITEADTDSFELYSDLTKRDKTWYLMNSSSQVVQEEKSAYEERIQRRAAHEPLQHITGKAYFYGREFMVNGKVLVPRFDTEVLVENALKNIKTGDVVLDICTGSGCIITTLALEAQLKEAVGIDISQEALAVAKNNADILGAKVDFFKGDLFDALKYYSGEPVFDVIVSNPPYIKTEEIKRLDKEVKVYDPFIALDGHEDGLYFYDLISKEAPKYLKRGGYILYEIGYDQGEAVSKLLAENGFSDIAVTKDLAGLDRVVSARLK